MRRFFFERLASKHIGLYDREYSNINPIALVHDIFYAEMLVKILRAGLLTLSEMEDEITKKVEERFDDEYEVVAWAEEEIILDLKIDDEFVKFLSTAG